MQNKVGPAAKTRSREVNTPFTTLRVSIAAILAVLISALMGCPTTNVPTGVKLLSVIWENPLSGGKSMAASRAISVAPSTQSQQAEFECSFGPIITSFQSGASAGGIDIGDTFTSDVYGGTVTTTISASGTDIVFNGVFNADSLNLSNYTLTLRSNNTFDFSQTIAYSMGGNFCIMAVVIINGATVKDDGSYSGTATGYVYYYNYPGDAPGSARYAISTGALAANSAFYGMRALQSTAPLGVFDIYSLTVLAPDSAVNVAQISSDIQTISATMSPYDFITFHNAANGLARAGATDSNSFLADTSLYGRNIKDLSAAATYEGAAPSTIIGAQYIDYVWNTYAQ